MTMRFNREFKSAIEVIHTKMEKVMTNSAERLMKAIIKDTPVDTGQLRGNWQASLDTAINSPLIGTVDPNGDPTIQKSFSAISNYNIKSSIYFTNNLDYAARIEFGRYSKKAPAGMMRINVRKFNGIVQDEARRANTTNFKNKR